MPWITSKSSKVSFLPSLTNSESLSAVSNSSVFVVGHTDCGGVKASVNANQRPDGGIINGKIVTIKDIPADAPLNRWLEPLTRTAISLKLTGTTNNNTAVSVVTRENVRRQCERLCETEVMMKAWQAGKQIRVYGQIYDIAGNSFQDVFRRNPPRA